jgi:hypothetical protein
MELRQSEIAAAAWRERYVAGHCELDEMEAGIARALLGECSDAEWIALSRERKLRAVDAILKSLYVPSH